MGRAKRNPSRILPGETLMGFASLYPSYGLRHAFAFLAADFTRALLDHSTHFAKRAQGRPGAGGTRGPLRERVRRENRTAATGEAQHTAFPARWSDGLCRALPGAEFLLASLTPAKVAGTAPVDANAAFAKA